MKAILFATGPLYHAAREALALRDRLGQDAVLVVAAAEDAAALRTQLEGIRVEPSGAGLLPRLWTFVGFGPAQVYCLSYGHSHRFLKLLAYGVRGQVIFVGSAGQARLAFSEFLLIRYRLMTAREPGTLLVASASPATLARLAEDLRSRRNGDRVDVLQRISLPVLIHAARRWRQYRFLAIPWTGEGRNVKKLMALAFHRGSLQIYHQERAFFL